jgi:flagellar basal body-associated protein FliL
MKEETDEEVEVPPVATPKKGGKVLPALAIMNTLLIAGVLAFIMKRPAAPAVVAPVPVSAEMAGHKALEAPGPTLRLENFIIQLRTTEAERYIRVAFDVELSSELDREGVVARISQVRDSVISYFADRTLEELRGSDGMDHIKQALLKRLNDVVPGRRLKAIYITEFIVQ